MQQKPSDGKVRLYKSPTVAFVCLDFGHVLFSSLKGKCDAVSPRVYDYYEIKYYNFWYNFVHEFYWQRKGDGAA